MARMGASVNTAEVEVNDGLSGPSNIFACVAPVMSTMDRSGVGQAGRASEVANIDAHQYRARVLAYRVNHIALVDMECVLAVPA